MYNVICTLYTLYTLYVSCTLYTLTTSLSFCKRRFPSLSARLALYPCRSLVPVCSRLAVTSPTHITTYFILLPHWLTPAPLLPPVQYTHSYLHITANSSHHIYPTFSLANLSFTPFSQLIHSLLSKGCFPLMLQLP